MNEEKKIIKAVDEFAEDLKNKMIEKFEEGWHGWDNSKYEANIFRGFLKHIMRILNGDNTEFLDTGVYCMILHRIHKVKKMIK